MRPKRRRSSLQVLAVARATAALRASIDTVSDARSDAPEYFTGSEAVAMPNDAQRRANLKTAWALAALAAAFALAFVAKVAWFSGN